MKVLTFCIALSLSLPVFADDAQIHWSEGEHLELGDLAAKSACQELALPDSECPLFRIRRRDRKLTFSYGEIVTSADFYSSAETMYNDEKTGIKKIMKCARKQQRVHEKQDRSDDIHYPSCNVPAFFAMPGYLEIVTNTDDHFGWHNMKAYVRYHNKALLKAQESFLARRTSSSRSRRLLQQALVYNAFADHFLTDGFAAGHIRIPRSQIKRWATSHLSGLFKSFRGDLLTWLLHDRESQSFRTNKEEGFAVKNSLNFSWRTRSDTHLHQAHTPDDPARELPMKAMVESIKEVLQTSMSGEIPSGIFKGTFYTPFHTNTSMVEKFSPAYQKMSKKRFLNSFYNIFPFYEKWIHKKGDLEKMLRALPGIFEQFRLDVRRDIKTDLELQRRLPPEYLEAYSKVQ